MVISRTRRYKQYLKVEKDMRLINAQRLLRKAPVQNVSFSVYVMADVYTKAT